MNKVVLTKLGEHYLDEDIKMIRTNLSFTGAGKKVIMVTSCVPDEGKSTLSLNLACSLAESGKKVFYIDADMRKSVHFGRLGVEGKTKGLSHFLSGQCEVDDILCHTQFDNLKIVFAGVVPPNPAELLGERLFEQLITAARDSFDYILIDCPPLASVIDAAVIATHCDAAVLVIKYGNVSRRLAQSVVEQLSVAGIPVLGTILNQMPKPKGKYGSYYGNYYGNYYGKYE